ncbi:hypothetical protein [Streptomyces sp. UNOC14_S4]|uniref:hypothetical protein n=1 Tax=Streptomyces sp. UNOC14_S4 TaxID=2872340 RepID=UPI001E62F77F|nr:hypothetical protein [Streptomyces sp. UNOC14_S4]MCC3771793.1 hypothetical protein [Streptomyces sp. UNOC14_S4]
MSPVSDPVPGSSTAFGPLAFQLVLLRRMADYQPVLVEEALRELGTDRTAMREANRRWQAIIRSPRQRGAGTRYRSVLGPPESTGERRVGELAFEASLWPVPLWPDLRFEVLAAPGGAVWNEWLVRAPGTPGPEPRAVADLRPWSCTVDEVARAFAPVRPMEGTAPGRWQLAFGGRGDGPGDERGGEYVADFTWGLLQQVTRR